MAEIITAFDLPASVQTHEMVDAMVAGANAGATRVAPRLGWNGQDADHPAPTADHLAEVRLVLIGAVQRWVDSGSGALQQQTAGPFGVTLDTRQRPSRYRLDAADVAAIQEVFADDVDAPAFAVDTSPVSTDWSAYEALGTL